MRRICPKPAAKRSNKKEHGADPVGRSCKKRQESRMSLKTNRRWMRAVLREVETAEVAMPWQRGTRRAEMLSRRETAKRLEAQTARAVAAR